MYQLLQWLWDCSFLVKFIVQFENIWYRSSRQLVKPLLWLCGSINGCLMVELSLSDLEFVNKFDCKYDRFGIDGKWLKMWEYLPEKMCKGKLRLIWINNVKTNLRLIEIEWGYKKKESVNEETFNYCKRRRMNKIKTLWWKVSKERKCTIIVRQTWSW